MGVGLGRTRAARVGVTDEFERHLRPDALVAIADGCGAPIGVGSQLGDAARAVGGVRVLLGWSMTAPQKRLP